MRITLNINDALLEELKLCSSQTKRPMTAIVNETLERGLSAASISSKPVKIHTFKIGIKPAYRGISMNQLYDQLEVEDRLKVAEE
ncbi:MAG: hypothetical protein AAGH40_01590 [Verrucomicrobiota bacterium]